MTLPRILILDDLLYWSQEERGRFCSRLGLFDVTDTPLELTLASNEHIAAAVFQSGQLLGGEEIRNDVSEALRQIEAGWREDSPVRWCLVLLDLQFDRGPVKQGAPLNPDTNWPPFADRDFGLRVLEAMTQRWPDRLAGEGNCEIPVVVLSALERIAKGKQASRAGARAYIERDTLDKALLKTLLDEHGLIEDEGGLLAGRSLALLHILRSAREVAKKAQGNLLVLGEPGTGKTELAKYIHRRSPRNAFPLQKFTVGAGMNADLLKGQLYGYWYGSHQWASSSESGLAERANGGTLFLDEIANLPSSSQTELLEFARCTPDGLRSLARFGNFPTDRQRITQARQSLIGQYEPETQKIFVDVFLITATNQRLQDPSFYDRSDFRVDLFVRLGQESHRYLEFPSLKDRAEDIPFLFERFLEEATHAQGGRWPKSIDASVLDALDSREWAGNVAELKGVAIEAEKASRDWDEVLPRHLPILEATQRTSRASRGAAAHPQHDRKAEVGAVSIPAAGIDLVQLDQFMKRVRIGNKRADLAGTLEKLGRSYGDLLLHILSEALERTRRPTGQTKSQVLQDLSPTSAVSLLLGRTVSSTQAADEIKRIASIVDRPPDPASDVGRVFAWAQARRKAKAIISSSGQVAK